MKEGTRTVGHFVSLFKCACLPSKIFFLSTRSFINFCTLPHKTFPYYLPYLLIFPSICLDKFDLPICLQSPFTMSNFLVGRELQVVCYSFYAAQFYEKTPNWNHTFQSPNIYFYTFFFLSPQNWHYYQRRCPSNSMKKTKVGEEPL